MTSDGATLDEIHITIEQFEDEVRYEPDGTLVIDSLGIRHRCPDGTPCAEFTKEALGG